MFHLDGQYFVQELRRKEDNLDTQVESLYDQVAKCMVYDELVDASSRLSTLTGLVTVLHDAAEKAKLYKLLSVCLVASSVSTLTCPIFIVSMRNCWT